MSNKKSILKMSNNNSSSGGVGFVGLLTILFIGLKLGEVIAWSWWWVLAPLWISALLGVAIIAFTLIGMIVVVMTAGKKRAGKK